MILGDSMNEINSMEQDRIDNNLRLIMIDRMLKEKYNEIHYLAIQPPKDPAIEEINKKDLEWLLSEHERADRLLRQNEELQVQYDELLTNYSKLDSDYREILNSLTWRIGVKISSFMNHFISPFQKLFNRK